MARSKVKWFDGKKGYGFIVNPEGGEDIFVHFSAIICEQSFKVLNQDADVDFELEKTQKGFQAKNVREVPVTGASESPSLDVAVAG
ncbi:cold-shock protein [Chlorobium phaeobacteroides]|jgi:CspA family cold shock protein|uniref:Cold-shock DNA-binding protein family n=1 Tax=Chlorobium phaeobacteroides (strain DSM 266 / SMG 266 / 2430) TaxID=290317 RepID=A1BHA2_CHLPD|nr:cold shock domain-containing protein [Chlorobium phaeobacteroides]ABL65779.1 cold-shock DNA-binding protein family [Chlorobium phaeobacteroides DSM 266]MBV5326094.1 cold shock domain-containing protein [Chlorobium sp.]